MALTYADLLEVDLGKLGTAVSDWKKSVDALKTAAESARKGMRAKSDAARWAGVNASVTREFVTKTTKEISDLHSEASSIHSLLSDGHTELVALQKKIRVAVQQEAPGLGVRVEDIGGGKVRCYFAHVRGDTDERTQEERDSKQELEDRINRLVAHASEIDSSLARALAKSHGGDKHNAGHRSYESLDDAQAERAAELAKLGPEMSDKQYMELNSIMKFNARDADFSTDFYKSLGGPKEALEFYGRMSLDGTMGDNKERLALTRQLQRNMGLALASATDPDNRSHLPASWSGEFRKLGTQRVELNPHSGMSAYGYQLLGGILRYGNYDARFINPIAEHVVQLHKKDPDRFMANRPVGASDLDWGFNPSGKSGAGYDPLTGVLEGLGHSPEAAKKFFTDPATAYREDGTVDKKATLDFKSYFDELNRNDFEWPPDSLAHAGSDEAKHARDVGPNALGHALEAATTGSAWDADPPALHRDEETWKIMEKVIGRYNVASEDGLPHEAMKDSLARMGAAYIDDLNYSIMDWGGTGDELGRGRIFGESGDGSKRASFGQWEARNFMMLVAADEDGYQTLSAAHQVYSASGLASLEDNRDDGLAFAHNAAKVNGILDESRSHGIREEFKDDETAVIMEENKQAEWRKTLMTGVLTAGVAGGTALVLGPAAGVVATTVIPVVMESGASTISTAYGNHTMEYLQDNEYKNDPRALRDVQELERVGERGAWSPVRNYAIAIGMTQAEQLALNPEIEQSYLAGKSAISSNEKVSA
ncbi:DUF6571 family protein [Streptomyces antibioticus]|uniref:AG2 protein n=1 Tax=Streptomyces antibioticus TaxID=1890 RepID=A0AAE6YAQ1_STRAT|nr:DUF6571 family protein [Streptomyces antibioticus]OOQ49442.1 hypothetical protein AFM16_24685 [Streptomyces antibioticus]QIT46398.1 hypothetical protein HCX60_25105 [Streptomyces antibioticus]